MEFTKNGGVLMQDLRKWFALLFIGFLMLLCQLEDYLVCRIGFD